ncbi:MAG TPA: aspartate carbamoyltransferase catalytic subunit [Alphaproteobacteria bacterium]|nr:aspartate carbamoyltransferase catalytic subunit [Alphaproteobacteria bacterium]HOO50982.1 aspartate carbamoyltransferase catalytic subunit [Alphaproteobacteria bacterium]
MTQKISVSNLCDIAPLSAADITTILDRAAFFKTALSTKTVPQTLKDKVILTLFTENSTRTRNSFEMAVLRLGGKLMNWDEKISSAQKGETFSDTLRYLNGYQPDAVVMRHHEYNAPNYVAGIVDCPVINAGDSYREHPTQALLDAFTIKEAKGKIDGLTIAIVGDLAHSRVAGSDVPLLTKMGATIHLIAPENLQPRSVPEGVKIFSTLEDGLVGCDVIITLRIQKERMDASVIPNDTAYFHAYGLTLERLALAKPDVIVMHPGPMNRGVEIADEVADDPTHSVIFQQGANGVPVRMAVLDLLVGEST